jgi:hypothetical protein
MEGDAMRATGAKRQREVATPSEIKRIRRMFAVAKEVIQPKPVLIDVDAEQERRRFLREQIRKLRATDPDWQNVEVA